MQYMYNGKQEVTVPDINMPFWSMVTFMVKWAIAAIPAMILLFLISVGLIMPASIFLAGIGGAIHGLTR